MVISFKLSRRGKRFYPPPPHPPPAAAAETHPPTAAGFSSGGGVGGCGGAASGDPCSPPPPPLQVDNMLSFDDGTAGECYIPDKIGTGTIELELEPSFALNLFLDGFSIGEPSKGMLLLMIGDDPKKRPYDRASKALLSAIEHGCLPGDILDGIRCKYLNGTIVCEVRDYRSCLSNDTDYSGYDFPTVSRVALRLGTEYVVKHLLSIMDASWTYHDQLLAESIIIKALQPRLNLDPTPCLDRLCSSVVKKLDLGLAKRRHGWKPLNVPQSKDASLLDISSSVLFQNANGCHVSKGAAVCDAHSAILRAMPSEVLNSSLLQCSSSLHINSTDETVKSDPDNTHRSSSSQQNSSIFYDKNQSASSRCDAGHLLHIHEEEARVTLSCADAHKNGQLKQESRRRIVRPQKRKKPSNLIRQSLQGQNCLEVERYSVYLEEPARGTAQSLSHLLQIFEQEAQVTSSCADAQRNGELSKESQQTTAFPQKRKKPSNLRTQSLEGQKCLELEGYSMRLGKTAKRTPQNISDFCQETVGTSIKENVIELAIPKQLPVEFMEDQAIHNEKTRVLQHNPSSITTNRPDFHFSNDNPYVKEILDKDVSSHEIMYEASEASFVDLKFFGNAGLMSSKKSLIATCSPCSKKTAFLEDRAVKDPRPTASKRKVSENFTSSVMQQNELTLKKQKKFDVQIDPTSENTSSESASIGSTCYPAGISESASIGSTCYPAGISQAEELYMQHSSGSIVDPDIQKILSEVITTTRRHGLNEKMAKVGNLKSTRPLSFCSLPPFQFFQPENAEECQHLGVQVNASNYLIERSRNCKNRVLIFQRMKYDSKGKVDESSCTLCLIESGEPDDHQVGVTMIFEDEHFHIATLPTSNHGDKFVAQFISLMERDEYRLVQDEMQCSSSSSNEAHRDNLVYSVNPEISQHILSAVPSLFSSTFSQQIEGASDLAHLTEEHPQCQRLSNVVTKSLLIGENKDMGYVLPKSPSDIQANIMQQESWQQLFLPQLPNLGSIETCSFSSSQAVRQLDQVGSPQARRPPFVSTMHLMNHGITLNLDKFPAVHASKRANIDQFQSRDNLLVPHVNLGTNDDHLRHQFCAHRDGKVRQVSLPAIAQETNFPLRAGRSILLPVPHPIGSLQLSSQTVLSDDSVTSSPVETPIR